MAKPQDPKKRVVGRAFATAINRQCPTCNRTVSNFTHTMPGMLKDGGKEETITIQITGRRGGPYLSVGSP